MWYPALRPLLFALDPERAHALALEAVQRTRHLPARAPAGAAVELIGLRFPNRVGLAAGFDKNAVAVDGLGRLGFGFIEVGTVTPRPQPGQPRPRLVRLPSAGALINRLGFPNDGAAAVAARLRHVRYRGLIGVNIGKNAATPLDEAIGDYRTCLRAVAGVADYVAVNISSPNTEALRDLHARERLEPLLLALLEERAALVRRLEKPLPLLLKVSPDLADRALEDVAALLTGLAIDGVIATNTTLKREGAAAEAGSQAGGLSGAPLRALALGVVTRLRAALGPDFPIVGVGGVDSPAAALAMRAAGADLVQLYTGLVYRGPSLVRRCVRALARASE